MCEVKVFLSKLVVFSGMLLFSFSIAMWNAESRADAGVYACVGCSDGCVPDNKTGECQTTKSQGQTTCEAHSGCDGCGCAKRLIGGGPAYYCECEK